MNKSYPSRNLRNSRNSRISRISRKKTNGIPLTFAIIVFLLVILFFSVKSMQDRKVSELAREAKAKAQKDVLLNTKDKITPSKNKLKYVVIDAGHGGFDEGASSSDGSLIEKDVVLNLSNKIKSYLIKDGIGVYMTRDSDIAINGATTEKKDLHNRSDLINSFEDAKLLVSIHNNANDDPFCSGIFNYISDFSNEYSNINEILSSNILNSIGLNTNWKVNSTNSQDIYILKHATMPSVLVECGFLSNNSDKRNLSDNSSTDELCQAIAEGIKSYLNNAK